MTKSYFPHFGAVFVLHLLVLMGTWHLSQSDSFRSQVQKLGDGVLKLQVASQVLMSEAVQKKVERVVPAKPQPEILKEKKSVSMKESNPVDTTGFSTTQGSEHGTVKVGQTDVRSLYKAELRSMIDKNKYYPTISKRLGHEGTVVVAFTLLEDGHIIDVRIDKPSRYEPLNNSALDAVKKMERFKPIPKEIGESSMAMKIPVKFKLI